MSAPVPRRRVLLASALVAGLFRLLPSCCLAHGEGPPAPAPGAAELLAEAGNAQRDGIPEVAVVKLRDGLGRGVLTGPEGARARVLLAGALLDVRKPGEALEALSGDDLPQPETDFLRARAQLRLRHWDVAGTIFTRLRDGAQNLDLRAQASLGLAAASYGAHDLPATLAALEPLLANPGNGPGPRAVLLAAQANLDAGRLDEARRLLARSETLAPHEATLARCLQGELLLREDRTEEAKALFAQVLSVTGGKTARAAAIAEIGTAKTELAADDYEGAEARLEQIIREQPRSPVLAGLFGALFEVYAREPNASDDDLVAWTKDDPAAVGPDRPAYALLYLGELSRKAGATERARACFQQAATRFADRPAGVRAALAWAREALGEGKPDEALDALAHPTPPEDAAVWQALVAEAQAQKGRFDLARAAYGKCLETSSPYERSRVWFNAALCSLRMRNDALFAADQQAFHEAKPDADLLAEFEFQKGRLQLAAGDAHGVQTLRRYLSQHPAADHVRDARLLLAEGALAEPNGAFVRVSAELPAREKEPWGEREERLAFFAAADDPAAPAGEAARLAQEFFSRYPTSPARAEVRLKLGGVLFHAGDFANARAQFEAVREEQPDSPLVETALFLAGEAARRSLNPSSVDEAIALFEEVYKMGGPLRFEARLEQALTKRQSQEEGQAVALLDDLLALKPPADVRNQAIETKGQALFTLAARDGALYAKAASVFEALTAPDASAEWRQRGLYEVGKCLEKMGQEDRALALYYDALDLGGTSGDQLWFFRAGFAATTLLEGRKAWESAAAVYDKLASSRSPRAAEAKDRLTKLRLEHFLWPD